MAATAAIRAANRGVASKWQLKACSCAISGYRFTSSAASSSRDTSFEVPSLSSSTVSQDKNHRRRSRRSVGDRTTSYQHDSASASINRNLHAFRQSLANQNVEKAWAARKALLDEGALDRLVARDKRDLRKLLARFRDHPEWNTELDIDACIFEMARQSVSDAVADPEAGKAMISQVQRLIGMNQDDQALAILEDYLAQAQLHQLPATHESADSAGISVSEELNASARDTSRRLPVFINAVITLLVYCHISLHGDLARLIPVLRNLPMPERSGVYLVRDRRAMQLYDFKRADGLDAAVVAKQEDNKVKAIQALRIAEIAWGLDRPAQEVGAEPLAAFFGTLLAHREAAWIKTAVELTEVSMEGTKPGPGQWLTTAASRNIEGGEPRAAWQERLDVTDSTWGVLLKGFLGAKDYSMPSRIWNHLHTIGISPSSYLYNSLLTGYSSVGQWDSMRAVWANAQEQNPDLLDVYCYTTMMNGLFRSRAIDDALHLFEELLGKASADPVRYPIQAETFNAVLFGLLVHGRVDRARELLNQMTSPSMQRKWRAPRATTTTWNIVLRHQSRQKDVQGMMATLDQANSADSVFEPDAYTFVTIMDALIRQDEGRTTSTAVQKVRQMMAEKDIKLNTVAWTTMIKGVLAQGSIGSRAASDDSDGSDAALYSEVEDNIGPLEQVHRVQAAMSLLQEMLRSSMRPNEVTLTSLISASALLQRRLDESGEDDTVALDFDDPDLCETMLFLTPIPQLNETSDTLEELKQHYPGIALALALLQRMRGHAEAEMQVVREDQGFDLDLNRKTFHYLLIALLRWHPLPRDGDSSASRLVFVRGLALLDEFTLAHDLEYNSEPNVVSTHAAPSSSSSLLTPLAPPKALARSAVPRRAIAEPNDSSWVIITNTLLDRHSAALAASPSRVGNDPQGVREAELVEVVLGAVLQRMERANAGQKRQHAGARGVQQGTNNMREQGRRNGEDDDVYETELERVKAHAKAIVHGGTRR
ncbi:unnamed protein product [Jaminaea pallidilutea]